ncbi:MAG TPA: hypothetical protein VL625_03835 [Patescibacteria group bacterium]|jgi:hypothetical protein|nr:hypothetical protein [Patescibacteria group bacterium]
MGGKNNRNIEDEDEYDNVEQTKKIDDFIKSHSHTDQPLKEQIMVVIVFMLVVYLVVNYFEGKAASYHYDSALGHGSGIATQVQSAPRDGTEKVKW